MRLLFGLLRTGAAFGSLVFAFAATAAYFGSLVPELDLLNHFQPLLFAGTLAGSIALTLLFAPGRPRAVLMGLTIFGFAASAATFVPEVLAGFEPRPVPPADGRPVVRIMTHNIFGLNDDMQRVAGVVRAENPDIVAFQEYFPGQAAQLAPLLKPDYPFYVHCSGGKRANIALFSRLAFAQRDAASCPENAYGRQRTAHILAAFTLSNGQKFSLLTTHLDWPAPIARQIAQFAGLIETVRSVKGPLVVVGDFNSTPWSYALRSFVREAGLVRQTRNLWTYPLRFSIRGWRDTWPFLPLDHVMTRGISVHALNAGPPTGSDHLPVVFDASVD